MRAASSSIQSMGIICHMQDVHLGGVDLNLLVALDALLAERSVTRAAARVGLTQPAMSHALARLRTLLDDPLFVRTPGGMVPTPRAEAMEAPIRRALVDIGAAIRDRSAFDPKTAKRAFTIATRDYADLVLLPPLVARLSREAPGVDLHVRTVPDDWAHALQQGEVDLVVAPLPGKGPSGVLARKLLDERLVCVMRKGHPDAKKPLGLARYLALRHALVAPQGRAGGLVDDVLAQKGLRRRVALRVPSFLVVPFVVARSDLVVTLAERVAVTFAESLDLAVLPPPLELSGFSLHLTWHERRAADAGLSWLRGLLLEVTKPRPRLRVRRP
jgi:DNA-binding transcriptional LysR family regulator